MRSSYLHRVVALCILVACILGLAVYSGTAVSQATGMDTGVTVVSITRLEHSPIASWELHYQVVFSAPVTGLSAENFSAGYLSSDMAVTAITGSGTTYNVTVRINSWVFPRVIFRLDVTNDNGIVPRLTNLPYRDGDSYEVDKQGPTPSFTSTAGSDHASTDLTMIPVRLTFHEQVTGLTVDDFQVLNGTVQNLQADGSDYTFDLVPFTATYVQFYIPRDAVFDILGNGNAEASYPFGFTATSPLLPDPDIVQVTLSTAVTNPTPTSVIPIVVMFDQPVSGFELTDLDIVNAAASNLAGSGANYTFDLTPLEGIATVSVFANSTNNFRYTPNRRANTLTITNNAVTSTSADDPSNPSSTIYRVIPSAAIYIFIPRLVSTNVTFQIAFNTRVTGVDNSDFQVIFDGTPGAVVTTQPVFADPDGFVYLLSVDVSGGEGTVQLNILDDDTIKSGDGTPLGGPGLNNGGVRPLTINVFPVGSVPGGATLNPTPNAPPILSPTPLPIIIPTAAPAPPPLLALIGGDTSSSVRADVPVDMNGNVFGQVLTENGVSAPNPAQIGDQALIDMGVLQAIDVFALTGNGTTVTLFNQPIQVCLQGAGRIFFRDANAMPRVSVQLPATTNGGYTCASIPNAGTVILVR